MRKNEIEAFWIAYLDTLPSEQPHRFDAGPEAWQFGYGEEMGDELGQLVLDGTKTATCSRYLGGNLLEEAGLSIILNGRSHPICLIETVEISIRPYNAVDAEFAKDEGEGDLSLAYWQKAHWQFFSNESEKEGYEVSEEMLLCCERFKVLYPIKKATENAE